MKPEVKFNAALVFSTHTVLSYVLARPRVFGVVEMEINKAYEQRKRFKAWSISISSLSVNV
jgi:hypothetical protein